MIDVKTLTMRVVDSDPNGIKICSIDGSSLEAVIVPRTMLARVRELPGIPERGIYYLLALSQGQITRAFAGKTPDGLASLGGGDAQGDWWDVAIAFVADDILAGDVLDGLEAAAIRHLRAHHAYEVDNLSVSAPYVNPYSETRVRDLMAEVLFFMAMLNLSLDVPAAPDADQEAATGVWHTKKRGIRAEGRYNPSDGSFDVLAGSQVDLGTTPGTRDTPYRRVRELRQSLIERRELVRSGSDYVLRVEQHFRSPSAAAVFVLGGSQDGWQEWFDPRGRTLDEVWRHGGAR